MLVKPKLTISISNELLLLLTLLINYFTLEYDNFRCNSNENATNLAKHLLRF